MYIMLDLKIKPIANICIRYTILLYRYYHVLEHYRYTENGKKRGLTLSADVSGFSSAVKHKHTPICQCQCQK